MTEATKASQKSANQIEVDGVPLDGAKLAESPAASYLTRDDNRLLKELKAKAAEASTHADPHNSGFKVGAAILIVDEENRPVGIFSGANRETHKQTNRSVTCGERNAIAGAVSDGKLGDSTKNHIGAVVVYTPTESPVTCCGLCRDVITDYTSPQGDAAIISFCKSKESIQTTAREMLPGAFLGKGQAEELGIRHDHGCCDHDHAQESPLSKKYVDGMSLARQTALEKSSAKGPKRGCAILTTEGELITGAAMENMMSGVGTDEVTFALHRGIYDGKLSRKGGQIQAVLTYTDGNKIVPPNGYALQLIADLSGSKNPDMIATCASKDSMKSSLHEQLPGAFERSKAATPLPASPGKIPAGDKKPQTPQAVK